MTKSTQLITYKTLSYIQYSLYFIYLRCILFLNTIDIIIFSNMLEEDDNNTSKSTNNFHTNHTNHSNHTNRRDSFNSLSRHTEPTSHFSIFDVNKTNFLNTHTKNKINDMEELLFSD